MTLTKEQELWALALWVEMHHGQNGDFYIAQQIDRALAVGDFDGIAMWRNLQERLNGLSGERKFKC